ncbi:MAG: RHS repeat-associated core domain-containing protein, partial [Fimbriimonadaceae bacterium]|nr:RHS repeat-associated core domain-containing protein [Fimbriimonadaceae bacterium]
NYTVDDADKLTQIKVGATTIKSYTYDTAGRTTAVTTSAGTTNLTYDYESRVTQITYPSTATNTFTYNGLDTRVGKVDSLGTATYKRDGDYVTAPVLDDGAAKFTPGISERRGTTSRFSHSDRMGSVTRQTSASQGSAASRQYDAFGNVAAVSGTWVGPFGFAGNWGYQEDGDSGLQLLGHRYYDPSTGRFLTRDPIKDGRNWYTYCENNPLTEVDPDGLQVIAPPPPPVGLGAGLPGAVGGGGAAGGAIGGGLAGPVLAGVVVFGLGWWAGRKIDEASGISTGLGNWLGGNKDYLPADRIIPRPTNGKGFHKGRGDDPFYSLTKEQLLEMLRTKKWPDGTPLTQEELDRLKRIAKERGWRGKGKT